MQLLSLLTDVYGDLSKVSIECKTGCLGSRRVPFSEVVTLSQLGKLGFPMARAFPPALEPHEKTSALSLTAYLGLGEVV